MELHHTLTVADTSQDTTGWRWRGVKQMVCVHTHDRVTDTQYSGSHYHTTSSLHNRPSYTTTDVPRHPYHTL